MRTLDNGSCTGNIDREKARRLPVEMPCGHEFAGQGTTWWEREPGEMHRYEVKCTICKRHIKWGAERDLATILKAEPATKVIPYTPPATLNHLFKE
jgi:hypothetical protein